MSFVAIRVNRRLSLAELHSYLVSLHQHRCVVDAEQAYHEHTMDPNQAMVTIVRRVYHPICCMVFAVFNSWDRQVYEFPDENGQPTTLRPNTIIRGNIGISNYNSVRHRVPALSSIAIVSHPTTSAYYVQSPKKHVPHADELERCLHFEARCVISLGRRVVFDHLPLPTNIPSAYRYRAYRRTHSSTTMTAAAGSSATTTRSTWAITSSRTTSQDR